jgi:hypothetical protein
MADSILKIEGIHPTIDGDYPISISEFTNRDFNDIKRIAHVRVRELKEAFETGDTDLFVAFAVIVLRHAGKSVMEDMLWDAPMGKLTLADGDEEEVDDLPPVSAPPSEAPNEHGGGERPNDGSGPSGASSRNGSDHQENDQSPTGHPPSGIGAMSASEMWAN